MTTVSDNAHDMVRILSKQNNGLNICHINAQSLRNKMCELGYLFENSDVDIICVSETWFQYGLDTNLYDLSNYNLYRSDRLGHAGGVAIYVRSCVPCRVVLKSDIDSQIEFIFVEINNGSSKLLVGCAYRPNSQTDLEPFLNVVENAGLSFANIILCGDFNCDILKDDYLTPNMDRLSLRTPNTLTPTHFTNTSSTLLDLFFVSDINKVLLYDQLSVPQFSKHDLLFLTYDYLLKPTDNFYMYRDFKNIDHGNLNLEMCNIQWDLIFYMIEVDHQADFLTKNINYLFNKFVPLRKKTIKTNSKPWFNQDIQGLIKQRDVAYKRWKRYKTPELLASLNEIKNKTAKEIKLAKTRYYENKFRGIVDSKEKWRKIRTLGVGKSQKHINHINVNDLNSKFVNINAPKANVASYIYRSNCNLRHRFSFSCVSELDVNLAIMSIKSNATGMDDVHPAFIKLLLPKILPHITFLFNSILTKSTFPVCWKVSKIIPTPKGNNEYRPIAVLPFLSKVLERLMFNQISDYLILHSLISNKQSGFRQKHSCVTALIEVIEHIRRSIDENETCFLILLDHTKAFDTVDHELLVIKLINLFGFTRVAAKLIAAYLHGRYQIVQANSHFSEPLPLNKGVTQASILGPLLFTLYINDLPDVLNECNVHMYADDVQIYMSCDNSSIKNCVNRINDELNAINNYATTNGLCINPSKSKCIIISKRRTLHTQVPEITIGNQRINLVDSAKNLGIIFNANLTWDTHINHAIGRVYSLLRPLWLTQSYTPQHIRMLIAKTCLLPTLLYGSEIFANADSRSKQRLKVVFNNITRYVFNLRRRISTADFSDKLFGMSLFKYLDFKVLVLLQKSICLKEPVYMYEKIEFLRSSRTIQIRHVRFNALISERQFYVYAIRLWNALPCHVKILTNARQFKNKLKKYLSSA